MSCWRSTGSARRSVYEIRAKLSDLASRWGSRRHRRRSARAAASAPAPVVPHAAAGLHVAHQLEDEAINLLKVAGMPVLKRANPVLAGVVAVLLIGLRAKARRRKR